MIMAFRWEIGKRHVNWMGHGSRIDFGIPHRNWFYSAGTMVQGCSHRERSVQHVLGASRLGKLIGKLCSVVSLYIGSIYIYDIYGA